MGRVNENDGNRTRKHVNTRKVAMKFRRHARNVNSERYVSLLLLTTYVTTGIVQGRGDRPDTPEFI
jgi:hypothetical protein